MRPQREDGVQRCLLTEEDDRINGGKGSEHACAFAFGDDGSAGALEGTDRVVIIDGDDEAIAEAPSLLEQRDVADVEQVKAAICEDDALAIGLPLCDARSKLAAVEQFFFRVESEVGIERGNQLELFDGRSSGFADDDAGSKVGKLDGGIGV